MRVTVKYVGESYSGEYIANHVIHEFSVYGGYTTTLYLKRNMAGGEKKRVSPIDSEMMRERLRRMEERMHGPVDREQVAVHEAEVESSEFITETVASVDAVETLIQVQDAVMNNPIYREGGGGPFGNMDSRATWCNQATFEIVRTTGSQNLATAMYGSDPNGYNTTANMAAVNLRQAASDIGGNIVEITAREAQDLANQGYTVVAARENTMGGSGHIATVRPRHEFNEVSGPTMNNIGAASRTGENSASDSFAGGYERGEVHFYYDREQFD